MLKTIASIAAGLIAFILLVAPAFAQNEPALGAGKISFGIGTAWGGLGINYIGIKEGENVGFTAGLGTIVLISDVNLGVVTRIASGDNAIFISGHAAYVLGVLWASDLVLGGGALEYGNIPRDSGDVAWRVGIAYLDGFFPSAGIGVCF